MVETALLLLLWILTWKILGQDQTTLRLLHSGLVDFTSSEFTKQRNMIKENMLKVLLWLIPGLVLFTLFSH